MSNTLNYPRGNIKAHRFLFDYCQQSKIESPKVTLYLLSTSTFAQPHLNFDISLPSVALLTFSLTLILECDVELTDIYDNHYDT